MQVDDLLAAAAAAPVSAHQLENPRPPPQEALFLGGVAAPAGNVGQDIPLSPIGGVVGPGIIKVKRLRELMVIASYVLTEE